VRETLVEVCLASNLTLGDAGSIVPPVPCPLCGYKIQPNELMRLALHILSCPKCSGVFDKMSGRKPISTS
jgi:predicted RNA-binding Zn-ribbon protein involved in translation (DUF1610 family)